MRLAGFVLAVSVAFGADWDSVQRIQLSQRTEVKTKDKQTIEGSFVSATAEAIVVRVASGQKSVPKGDVRQVRIVDPSRRMRNGVLWTVVGAAAGAGAGVAACPYCPNEGNTSPYIGPGAAAGAAIGALAGFLPTPWRTLYKSK